MGERMKSLCSEVAECVVPSAHPFLMKQSEGLFMILLFATGTAERNITCRDLFL